MNLERPAFLAKCEADFNLPPIRLEKSKASHMMCRCEGFDVDLHGPEVGGYSNSARFQSITINGWGYALVEGEWQLMGDGLVGWRRGENLYPQHPPTAVRMW